MATFSVNGKTVTVEKNQKLIRYLRDELKLTSVKDGCSEGACGTCHIIVDGKLFPGLSGGQADDRFQSGNVQGNAHG